MKKSLLIAALLCLIISSFAAKIPVEKASTVAIDFYSHYYLHDSGKPVIDEINVTTYNNIITIYTLNFKPSGYVIVAGDDASIPILGSSEESNIPRVINNPALKSWLDSYSREIYNIVTHGLNNKETLKKWAEVSSGSMNAPSYDVSPLLTTTWDQGCYYNALCPADASGSCGHVYTGCVATAMSQIMKYHNFPPQGVGTHTYVDPTYGTQTADFGITTYNWSSMPNNVTSPNTAVATLMYHAGVSVNMQYSTSGSGAYSTDVPYALMNYFNYAPGVVLENKSDYPNVEDFKNLIRTDLDQSLPVYYSGSNPTEGHAFVCDGYRMSDGTFHFNWGWSGSSNGWYAIGALNPGGYQFNDDNAIVIHIKPYNPNLIVRITHPVNNAVIGVGYSVQIKAATVRGTDNLMKLFIDNIEITSSTTDSISYAWNTSEPDLGNHDVKVYSYSPTDTVYNEINLNVAEWITQASGFTTIHAINYMSASDSNTVWATSYLTSAPTGPCSDFTRTTDGGNTWIPGVINNTTGLASSMVFAMSATKAYVPMYKVSGSTPQGIYVTTNGGATWSRQATAPFSNSASFPDCIHFFDSVTGWALGDPILGSFEIYTTTNGGTNWTAVSSSNIPAPLSGEYGIIGYYSAVNDSLWFGTNMGRIYHSTDKGHTWSVSTVTPFNNKFIKPVFSTGMHGLVQDRSQGSTGSVCESFDGGLTWTLVNATGPTYPTDLTFVPGSGNVWVTAGSGGTNGSSYSFNGGHFWNDFVGTQGAQYMQMTWLNNHCGWAGGINTNATEDGIYKFIGHLTIPLPPPTNLQAQSDHLLVHVSWQQPVYDTNTVNLWVYNLYRNNIFIGHTADTMFDDHLAHSGMYTYCVTSVYTQGESAKICTDIEADALGVDSGSASSFSIYPNPASDQLYIRSGAVITNLKLSDLSGRMVLHMQPEKENLDIQVSPYPSGIYVLSLETATGSYHQKIVIH
jgi:photosystem II stability/assembly factor-like uncharacterized protein